MRASMCDAASGSAAEQGGHGVERVQQEVGRKLHFERAQARLRDLSAQGRLPQVSRLVPARIQDEMGQGDERPVAPEPSDVGEPRREIGPSHLAGPAQAAAEHGEGHAQHGVGQATRQVQADAGARRGPRRAGPAGPTPPCW